MNITTGNNEHGAKMSDLEKIDDMISAYTGDANHFKKGIIWDNDPEVGDKVSITVIATGFQYSRLVDLTDAEGKLINISKDFTYNRNEEVSNGEASIPETISGIGTIGFNTNENNRTFHFSEENIPSLIVKPDQSIGELEGTAAIRRAARPNNDQQI